MGRRNCCSKEGMNRGTWTAFEDKTLSDYILLHGEGKWRNLPKRAGLKRCGKSCRLRWLNYLRPDIKRGNITIEEEDLIVRLHKLLGNRWSLIAGRLPGRTDNEIKNYWNTRITKKLKGTPTSTSDLKLTRIPSNQNLTPMIQRSTFRPPSPEQESRAIRTKASRFTRILHDQGVDIGSSFLDKVKFHNDEAVGLRPFKDGRSPPPLLWNDSLSSDCFMDFDMDEKFLSDFLSAELFDTKTTTLSPISDNTLLFPSENIPFLDSSLDYP